MANTSDARRILELLAQGKITVDEADQLLRAVDGAASTASASAASAAAGATGGTTAGASDPVATAAKWLRVTVDKAPREGRPRKQVSVRVPMALVRGGMKLGAIFPKLAHEPLGKHLRDQGIDVDFSKIDLSQI